MGSTTFADIADEVRNGYQPNAIEDIPYIGLEHIEQQTLHYIGVGSSKDVVSTKKKFQSGDILFGTLRPYFRKVVLARKDGVCSTDIAVIRPKHAVSSRFVQYMIADKKFIDHSMGTSNGTRMPRAKWSIVSSYPLPPNYSDDMQENVGKVLGAYDDLIENNSKRIEILEAIARLFYQQCLEDSVGTPISDVTSLVGRGISPKYDEGGNSIVINQRCIREHKIDLTVARRQTKLIPETKLIRNGDVLINSTGVGTLGRVAQVFGEYKDTTVDSHVSIVRPNDSVDPYFFGAALLDRQEDFERLGTGATGQTELGRDAIGRVTIQVPTPEVQQRVGDKIKTIRGLVYNLKSKNLKLAAARDSLLPRLMSGEIEI